MRESQPVQWATYVHVYEHAMKFCLDRKSPVKSALTENEVKSSELGSLYWTSEKWINSAQFGVLLDFLTFLKL